MRCFGVTSVLGLIVALCEKESKVRICVPDLASQLPNLRNVIADFGIDLVFIVISPGRCSWIVEVVIRELNGIVALEQYVLERKRFPDA